jgi:hypothetical protein
VSSGVVVALALVCAFGFAVRLWGIGYLVPVQQLGDSSVLLKQVDVLRNDRPRDYGDPDMLFYPLLFAHAVAILPAPSAAREGASLDEHLRAAAAPWCEVRVASVVLSMLMIPATWWLARRFMRDRWAVIAAALCATSLLHVDYSAQEVPHGVVSSFIALTLIAAIRLRRRADVASYWLAGACAALAVGSLQNGVAVLPAVAAAIFLRERSEQRASPWWSLAIAAAVAWSVLAFYPFLFATREGGATIEDAQGRGVLALSGHEIFLQEFNGRGFANLVHTLWCYDPILFVAAAFGALLFAIESARGRVAIDRERRNDLFVVLAFAIPYALAIGMYARSWDRFALPLLPVIACTAAWGIARACTLAGTRTAVARGATLLAACVVIASAVPAMQLARVRAAPSTSAIAADWIRAHAAPHERIVCLPYLALPLLCDDDALAANARLAHAMPWIRYQVKLDASRRDPSASYGILVAPTSPAAGFALLERDPTAYFEAQRARFVVLGIASEELPTPVERARTALRLRAPPLLRITPERIDSAKDALVGIRHPDPTPDRPLFERPYGLDLLDAARMGWTLEIYRVD